MQKHNVQEFNLTEARLFEQNIVGKIENVRHAFNKIQNTVESSREWWKGGSEREFINDFMRTRTEMERFLKAWLEEYREIMNQVAAGYVEDEEYLKSDIMKQAFRDFEMSLGSGIPIAAGVSGAEVKRSGAGAGKIPSIKVTGVTQEDLEMKKLALDEAEYNLRQAEANYKKNPSHNYMLALAAAGSAYTTAETQYDSVNKAWIKQNEDAWTDWNVYETEPFTIWQAQLQAERLAEIKANPKPGTNNQFNTLANIESDIYTKESIGKSPQCPWYAYGRTNEVTGMKLEFDGLRHGGWWVKNVKENDYVMPISDERKYDPDFIRAPSVASFLFEVDASDGDIDFYGHVVFIEAVEHTPDGVFIYYSESNTGKGIGTITKIEFESFTKMYDKKTAYPGEDIYQGFILLN